MKIKLTNVRLAFPQLWEAKTVNGEGKPAFSASFLLAPDHPDVARLNAAIDTVAREKWGAKADAVLKAMRGADKVCLHDGDIGGEPGAGGGIDRVDGRAGLLDSLLVVAGDPAGAGFVEAPADHGHRRELHRLVGDGLALSGDHGAARAVGERRQAGESLRRLADRGPVAAARRELLGGGGQRCAGAAEAGHPIAHDLRRILAPRLADRLTLGGPVVE